LKNGGSIPVRRGGCDAPSAGLPKHSGGGKMQTFKLGKQMTPAELLLAYKTALEAIAKGSPDPVKIAQEALSL
jgi:hypothetical protein